MHIIRLCDVVGEKKNLLTVRSPESNYPGPWQAIQPLQPSVSILERVGVAPEDSLVLFILGLSEIGPGEVSCANSYS